MSSSLSSSCTFSFKTQWQSVLKSMYHLESLFSLLDLNATHEMLSVIQQLHLDAIDSPSAAGDYSVDLGTLECISMASARRSVDLNLKVWDMVEQFGYSPTATMFEDVIMSFASTKQDKNLFSALADMERNGFVPSPTLLRHVAVKCSYKRSRMDHCNRLLTWHENEHMRSTSCMNVMLLGYGMSRCLNEAFFVFEELPRQNLEADVNTYCFLLESLYIDSKDRFPYIAGQDQQYDPQAVDDVVGAAQIILDAMDEAGFAKTKLFYYEHIRLLYSLGLLEESKFVLEEAIAAGSAVPQASIFMLSLRYAERGDFENARYVASLSVAAGCGEFPNLEHRIKKIQDERIH